MYVCTPRKREKEDEYSFQSWYLLSARQTKVKAKETLPSNIEIPKAYIL